MKNSDIEKQLKKEGENAPDIYERILLAAQQQGLLDNKSDAIQEKELSENKFVAMQEQVKSCNEQGRSDEKTIAASSAAQERRKIKDFSKIKKRRVAGLATSFAALAACIVILVIALSGGGFAMSPVVPTDPINNNNIVATANQAYAMGAATGARLMSISQSTQASQTLALAEDTLQTNKEDIKDYLQKFNEYFTALDSFFGEDYFSLEEASNTDAEYPYDTKLTVKYTDMNDVEYSCVMYFTETLVKEKTDGKESKKEYSLKGISIADGAEYIIEGERVVEEKKDEYESELKIRTYSDIRNKSDYIQMQQEYSVESNETEIEYVYSVYQDGKLVEQTSIELESERKGNKESHEYEFEFISGETKCKYSLEREIKDGSVKVKVEYDINGEKGRFTIEPSQSNENIYMFEDGTTVIM